MAKSIKFPEISFRTSKNSDDFDKLVDEVEDLNAQRSALDPLKDYVKLNSIMAKKIAKVQSAARLYFGVGAFGESVKPRKFAEWMEDNGVNFDTFKMNYFNMFMICTESKKKKDDDKMDELGGSCIIETESETYQDEIAADADFDY